MKIRVPCPTVAALVVVFLMVLALQVSVAWICHAAWRHYHPAKGPVYIGVVPWPTPAPSKKVEDCRFIYVDNKGNDVMIGVPCTAISNLGIEPTPAPHKESPKEPSHDR